MPLLSIQWKQNSNEIDYLVVSTLVPCYFIIFQIMNVFCVFLAPRTWMVIYWTHGKEFGSSACGVWVIAELFLHQTPTNAFVDTILRTWQTETCKFSHTCDMFTVWTWSWRHTQAHARLNFCSQSLYALYGPATPTHFKSIGIKMALVPSSAAITVYALLSWTRFWTVSLRIFAYLSRRAFVRSDTDFGQEGKDLQADQQF